MVATLSTINTLDVYQPSPDKPWNAQRIQHFYHRLGYGASKAEIDAALIMTPEEFVEATFDNILNLPIPAPPPWANWTWADYNDDDDLFRQHQYELIIRWVGEMSSATENMRSKLAMFWHNHFVTEIDVYECTSYMWAYYNLLHTSVLGNFRTFVEEMGKNPAMLHYLDGDQNIADEPNENYGRELMELFTMGENNGYTQDDIVNVARALTGYVQNYYNCEPPVFAPQYHDNGQKTIFGQTGNWNYDDVHELIFTLRSEQVSHYICGKIYKHFVHDDIDEGIVAQMATTFKDNNWELAPVFIQLFKSEHFFEDRFINAKVKSPYESFNTMLRVGGMVLNEDYDTGMLEDVAYWTEQLGQRIFSPVDVAGWPGQRNWMNENTLTLRWSFMQDFLFSGLGDNDSARAKLRQLAIDLTDLSKDPVVVTEALAQHFLNTSLDAGNLETAVQYFKGEIPENYFEDGTWNLYFLEVPDQILNLLFYLTRLPEWQLG